MDDAANVSKLLDERPELESPLREVFEVDAKRDGWTFEDVPVDSGAFGELVSRGFVEEVDDGDGYRVTDPEVVRVVLDGEIDTSTTGGGNSELTKFNRLAIGKDVIRDRLRDVDDSALRALSGALLAVVMTRLLAFGSVFRDGAIVLSGNDPYYYRYWVEQAVVASDGVLGISGLATMSGAVRNGEPLLVATLWAGASLFGGDATATGLVLAWYPVVAAVVTAVLVYLLCIRVTDDRRIALAAVLLLAVTPAHAFRTSIGFADHHAFDYVWLALTAYGLVRLDGMQAPSRRFDVDSGDGATEKKWKLSQSWRDFGPWAVAASLGFAVTGQTLAWDASPLLLAPLGLYVAVRVLDDVRSGRSPVAAHLPLVAGLGLAALLVVFVHTSIGWHSETVAFAPTLLLVGVVGVVAIAEFAHRFKRPASELAGAEAVGGLVGVLALRTMFPAYWTAAVEGVARLTARRTIAEVQSLLSGDTFGWLLLFGFVLALAVPFLVWGTIRAYRGERIWLVPSVYCWYFLMLAIYQVRFAGQLAIFASVFAGLGFIYLSATVDLADTPVPFADDSPVPVLISIPSWQLAGRLVVLFLLVGGLSFIQVPIKTSQVTTDGDAYWTAAWMNEYADEQGWEYPENYVFSRWGGNRMYNYFVNGEAQSYTFAQEHFSEFATATDGQQWYERLHDKVGFIVVDRTDYYGDGLHRTLSKSLGSTTVSGVGIGHYRAVFISDDGSLMAFTLVPGARLTGPAEPNTTVTISTDVRLGSSTYSYTRRVSTGRAGIYSIRVPYAGQYSIGAKNINIKSSLIRNGWIRSQFDGAGKMHWSFNAGSGETAYDRTGGYHGRINNGTWTSGVDGNALTFNRSRRTHVVAPEQRNGTDSFTVSAWIRASSNASGAILSTGKDGRQQSHNGILFNHGSSGWTTDRLGLHIGNGSYRTHARSPALELSYPSQSYHHVTVVFDRGTIRWYLDGELLGIDTIAMERVAHDGERPTYLGREYSSRGGKHYYQGDLDEIRYYDRAISNETVTDLFNRHVNATN